MNARLKTEKLVAMIKTKRGDTGLRATSREIGISPSTLSRVEQGKVPDIDTFIEICNWLNASPSGFFDDDNEYETSNEPFPQNMSTPEKIGFYLRADENLNSNTAEAIEKLVKAAYEAIGAGKLGTLPKED